MVNRSFGKRYFSTYYAFLKGEQPVLPALDFQYKEFLQYSNEYREKHFAKDRDYWHALFPQQPPEIFIPGSKGMIADLTDPECITFTLTMPDECRRPLNGLMTKHSTTLFILMQTFLKLYICRLAGINDISIASEMFGREMIPGAEHQIGFYARMRMIRTKLDTDDDIHEAIRKVKKANEDMQDHVGLSLMDTIGLELSPGQSIFGTMCKITVNYTDMSGYYIDTKAGNGSPLSGENLKVDYIGSTGDDVPIKWDFDIHFYNLKSRIDLTVIYRRALYEEQDIRRLMNGFLEFIVKNTSSTA